MQVQIQLAQYSCQIDLTKPISIAIPLEEGAANPNCYYAENPTFEVIRFGDSFVGSVAEGGVCNYQKISVTPHGNGTHTECVGHLTAEKITVNTCLKTYWFVAKLISVTPQKQPDGDEVIQQKDIEALLNNEQMPFEALIIRSLPNPIEKKQRYYSGTNPPYLQPSIGAYLLQKNITQLLLDLPSVDRESDQGKLSVHKGFWNLGEDKQITEKVRLHATITELVYVPDEVKDGIYLLNLQIPNLAADAVPSMPVLYSITMTCEK